MEVLPNEQVVEIQHAIRLCMLRNKVERVTMAYVE
jgi:hypothetical protein